MRAPAAALAVVLVSAVTGCFKSDAPSCTVHCAVDTDCPGDQTCTAAGMCSIGTQCTDQPDAPPGADAGPTAPLTVTVFNSSHAILAGAQVLFIDPGGAEAADTVTDGNGQAVHDMAAGSSVAVVRRDGSSTLVSSFVDLPLGASIESEAVPLLAYDQITLSWTPEPMIDQYWVYATCGVGVPAANTTTGTSIQILLDHRCSNAYDAVVVGRDNTDSIAPVAQVVGSVSGSFTFTGTWSSLIAITGQVQGIPSNVTSTTASAAMFVGAGRRATEPIATSAIAGDVIVDALELPSTDAALIAIDLTGAGTQTVFDRAPIDGAPYDGALDGEVLPWISDLAIDLAGRKLRWTATDPIGPAPASVDAVFAELSFQRAGAVYIWDLVAPGARFTSDGTAAMGEIVFPDLPGDRDFEPRPGDTPGTLFHAIAAFAFNPGVDTDTIRAHLQRTWFDRDFFDDVDLARVTVSYAE